MCPNSCLDMNELQKAVAVGSKDHTLWVAETTSRD